MSVAGYEVEAPLGRGAMGTVHRARRLDALGRVVALKRVPMTGDPSLTARLRQEASVLASLDHPHIVRILELVPDGDGVAIAMQLAAGGSLEDRLRRDGAVPAVELASMAAKLSDALASAHRRGVLHCDVKPGNILFTADDEPLLSDFGLARWMARASLWGGAVLGTAEYLDPAVAEGGQLDERSDVYALGVVCYEALVGRPPFSGATPLAVLRAADRGAHDALESVAAAVPAELAAVVERAMARRPSDRYSSASDLAAALRSATGVAVPDSDRPSGTLGCRSTPNCPVDAVAPIGGPSRPTREFGTRPLAPLAPTLEADRGRRRVVASARVALALAVSAGAAVVAKGLAENDNHATRRCTAVHPTVTTGVSVLRAHTTSVPHHGGWTTDVVWDRRTATATVGATRYVLGRDGDRLLIGDWDGNGTATPALYRPADGRVFLFAEWAGPGARLAPVSVRSSGVIDGRPVVASAGGRRQRIEVRAAT